MTARRLLIAAACLAACGGVALAQRPATPPATPPAGAGAPLHVPTLPTYRPMSPSLSLPPLTPSLPSDSGETERVFRCPGDPRCIRLEDLTIARTFKCPGDERCPPPPAQAETPALP